MKSVIAAIVCVVVGIGAMWVSRLELAKSPMLLTFISFWLLMGFLFALHADTAGNLQVIVQNIPGLRGLVNDRLNAAAIPDAPVVVPHADEAHHDA